MAFEQVVQTEWMANKDIIMYPAIEKKKCKKCKEETYNLIDGYCHKCFFEVTRQREKEYRERQRQQEEKRERAKK